MENKIVVIGDVHGCIRELDELLDLVHKIPGDKRIVFLGDLMDRGPDPIACLRRVREISAECVLGNHDDKHIRYRQHEDNRRNSGKPNPMKPMSDPERLANESLSLDDIAWLKSLPVVIRLMDNVFAVHGGCEPRVTLSNQLPNKLMRARFVDMSGKMVTLNPDKTQPKNTQLWTTLWKGPESIVYGHVVHDGMRSRYDEFPGGYCLGIDTGCCFGGSLTAAVFYSQTDYVLYSVAAKQKYFARAGDDE